MIEFILVVLFLLAFVMMYQLGYHDGTAAMQRLVDLTWQEAMEDQSVPSMKIVNRLIKRARKDI